MIAFLKSTMVIERLLGVSLYAGVVLLAFFLLRRAKNAKMTSYILDGCLIILCVMAFVYIPDKSADVYRWLELTKGWPNVSFMEFLTEICFTSTTPIAYFVFYICRLTGLEGMISLASAFLFYFNIFYIFQDLRRKPGVSSESIATSFLFFMAIGRFLETISGLRSMVALAILARCFYDEIINKKPIYKNLIWELFAALYHLLGIMVLGVRVIFLLFQKVDNKQNRIMNLVLVSALCVLGVGIGGELVVAMIQKAIAYLTTDKYSYVWEYIIAVLVYLVMMATVIECCRSKKTGQYLAQKEQIKVDYWENITLNYKNWLIFNGVFLFIELAFCYQYSIFHRLCTFSSMLIIPLIVKATQRGEKNFVGMIQILSLLILLLACIRGDLCGYKFFLIGW